jgi:signal transduction histidine kinase
MPEKEKHEVELSSVIERSLSLISHLIENKNIKIIKHFNLVPNVVIYENELIQVVINILTNAIDALEEKTQKTPTITLRLFQNDEDEIFITISDNAGGISKNIIDNVFDLYFSTKSKNGTGLGLYMSKIIVEKHLLGDICVKNTPYGAKFIIVLNQKKILQHRCEKLNG